jgi:hypothetical protein
MNNEKGNNDLESIIDSLTKRVKELEDINEAHRHLNAELRVEIQMWKDMSAEYEKTKNLLQGYKKVIEDLSKRVNGK